MAASLSCPGSSVVSERCQRRRGKGKSHVIGALSPHLLGALHVDVEQDARALQANGSTSVLSVP